MISTHEYTATLTGTTTPVDIKGGSITLDDQQAPHVQATISIPFPGEWSSELTDDPLAGGFGADPFGEGPFGGVNLIPLWALSAKGMATLDPRKALRIVINVNVTAEDYTHARRFDLALRERSALHADGSVTLTLASDETLLGDWAPLTDDTAPLARRASLRGIINYVLGRVLPGTTLAWGNGLDHSFAGLDYDLEAFTWKAGQSALAFLIPLAQTAGYRIVCDELRGWTLRDEEHTTGGSITIRQGLNAIDGTDRISLDDDRWFDAAVTRYRWTDRDGQQQERVDAYARRIPYRRLQLFERDTPYPGAGFSTYAVRRAMSRGRDVSATLVADWRAQAEMPVVIDLDGTPTTQTGRIGRVEFDLDRDEMTVTTRTTDTPPTAWMFIPDGEKWSDRRGRPWKKASA